MPKPIVEPTTAENFEAKFDAGEDVLDYFDQSSAKVILPKEIGKSEGSPQAKTKRRKIPARSSKKSTSAKRLRTVKP